MTPAELLDPELSTTLTDLRDRDEPFAIATIVRTAGLTAAKPGAKAVLRVDGTIIHGWLGGGCTRGAVKKAAIEALKTGTPQLISIAPEDMLSDKGLSAGDVVDGVTFARNGCPSKGAIDVFIEPSLPQPELIIFGASPVAQALTKLAGDFDWAVTPMTSEDKLACAVFGRRRAIVVATQGQGDVTALTQALSDTSDYVAFVGSRKKFATLALKMADAAIDRSRVDAVQAPAGLDIGAITPEEIALSILAQLTQVRRSAFVNS